MIHSSTVLTADNVSIRKKMIRMDNVKNTWPCWKLGILLLWQLFFKVCSLFIWFRICYCSMFKSIRRNLQKLHVDNSSQKLFHSLRLHYCDCGVAAGPSFKNDAFKVLPSSNSYWSQMLPNTFPFINGQGKIVSCKQQISNYLGNGKT